MCGGKSESQDGDTALILAAASGHADCARLLIDTGADKDATASLVRVGYCFDDATCLGVAHFILCLSFLRCIPRFEISTVCNLLHAEAVAVRVEVNPIHRTDIRR